MRSDQVSHAEVHPCHPRYRVWYSPDMPRQSSSKRRAKRNVRDARPNPKEKHRAGKRTTNKRVPEWALSFLKGSSDVRRLRPHEQTAMEQPAMRVLRDKRLKRNEALRNGAVRLVVALLPKTFPALEEFLSDSASPLWYEVQFTAFCALDRDDLGQAEQKRVVTLIEDYLMNVKSRSGYAAWKAGDLLGDEWKTRETVQILERALFAAKHAAGRNAALHGLEHAIRKATPSERQRLFSLIRKAASADRSAEVRKNANLTLEGVGCHHMSAQEVTAGGVQPD